MTKKALNIYLVLLLVLVLFALSPFAFLGGLVVALVLVIPAGVAFRLLGLDISGRNFDSLLEASFLGASALLVLIAFWVFYRAASAWDARQFDNARSSIAIGATLITLPLLVHLFYHALPGIG
ncbi:hypothetical protein [Altererythrobacter sp. GH1-8]|uniref:hypothetical protein n=1 Tax=Altererythrobacter sp. GH1-8 TaxID=3349333 RepID=UPI00374CEFCD